MKKIISKGFTVIEILVTMAIFTVISSVVLFNYSSFNDTVALSSAEQEIAIAIRQAQAYGLNVKEAGVSTGQFNYAYGVYFDPQNNSSNYYIFVDSNNNKRYDVGSGCGSGSTECLEKLTLRNNVRISRVCDTTTCWNNKMLNVTFKRPNPDTVIYLFNIDGGVYSGPITTGKVELVSPKGRVVSITTENTGQITVQ